MCYKYPLCSSESLLTLKTLKQAEFANKSLVSIRSIEYDEKPYCEQIVLYCDIVSKFNQLSGFI